jgi:hypothetical protein
MNEPKTHVLIWLNENGISAKGFTVCLTGLNTYTPVEHLLYVGVCQTLLCYWGCLSESQGPRNWGVFV